ncbi:MAG: hypothetical protein VB108_07775 [Anaerolineaceae bacterium]|nr:hypothetical protein [Anaerolineaceae bacterium]
MINLDLIGGILGLILTVMVFSYLAGDNFFFRVALTLLIGVGAGYTAALLVQKVLLPHLIQPLLNGKGPSFYLSLFSCFFILLLLSSFFGNVRHLARIPLALMMGTLAAVSLYGLARGTLAPQILALVNRFSPVVLYQENQPEWLAIVKAAAMLLGVISVLLYFDRHRLPQQGGKSYSSLSEGLSEVGQVFIGISFGAIFAGVFATALIALLGRIGWVQTLMMGWLGY